MFYRRSVMRFMSLAVGVLLALSVTSCTGAESPASSTATTTPDGTAKSGGSSSEPPPRITSLPQADDGTPSTIRASDYQAFTTSGRQIEFEPPITQEQANEWATASGFERILTQDDGVDDMYVWNRIVFVIGPTGLVTTALIG